MNDVHVLVPPNAKELLAAVLDEAGLAVQARKRSGQDYNRQLPVAVLPLALLIRDPHLYTHSYRVRLLTHHLVHVLQLPQDEATSIELAALVHDIGKLAIPPVVLQKASQLTHEEFAHIKQHPAYGVLMLEQIGMLNQARCIVYHHHEHWDGSGYPCGLQGTSLLKRDASKKQRRVAHELTFATGHENGYFQRRKKGTFTAKRRKNLAISRLLAKI